MNTWTPSCLWAKKTMFYEEAINDILQLRQEILYTNNDFGKVYKRGVSIEAFNDLFLNEIREYNFTNEEQ